MLSNRIISTIKFFNLQNYPLTLLELENFLLPDTEKMREFLDKNWELEKVPDLTERTGASEILECLENEMGDSVSHRSGFYCLKGREDIIRLRLRNYLNGIKREKKIRKHIKFLRHLPFIRGIALAGSQAMGEQKPDSDIDLLVITENKYLWLTRTLITTYFQFLGARRHGEKISNRFCLNHYLVGPKTMNELRNLYTAWEYAKLRPLVYYQATAQFQSANADWIRAFFPNFMPEEILPESQSGAQRLFEGLLKNKFGLFLEEKLKNWQLPKIRQEKFIVVQPDELSFHPNSKQQLLLDRFFEFQQ